MARAMNALCEMLPAKKMWSTLGEKQWALPVSSRDQSEGGLRKRIGSYARSERKFDSGSPWSSFRSRGEDGCLRKWWQWGWGWVTSKKKTLCRKMSIFEDEDLILGHGGSAWRQTFRSLRANLRKLVKGQPTRHEGLNYNSFNYARNFDDGGLNEQEDRPVLSSRAPTSSSRGY